MAGIVPPKLKEMLDALRAMDLPGEAGERVRKLIDQSEREVTNLAVRLKEHEAK